MSSRRWIFLRGLTRGNIHWGQFAEMMKSVHHCEIEFLEIPGNGYLSHELSLTNINQLIEYLKRQSKFYQQQGLKVNLCGISLGGMIALKWAELDFENIESVMIINSSLKQFSPFYHRLIPKNYLKILSAVLNKDIEKRERLILEVTSNHFQETRSYLKLFSAFSIENKVSKLNVIRQLVMANKIDILTWPKIPLIVVVSENDRLVNSLCSKRIAKKFGGTLIIHPHAGHDLPLDVPEWLAHFFTT